jgi:hypothetical protein
MDKPSKRGDKIPRKMTPEHLAWGRELGHATNTPVDDIDDSGDDDYQEFLRLSDECAVIEDELKTVMDPEGASGAEAERLAKQRTVAKTALQLTKPREGRAAVDTLKQMVVDITKAIVDRKLNALSLQLANLVDLPELSKAEVADMAKIRTKFAAAVQSKNVKAAIAALDELDTALTTARGSTDDAVLLARLNEALNAKNADLSRIAYERCVIVGVKVGAQKIGLRQLGILDYAPVSTTYTVDASTCTEHIKVRHTREGIWRERRLLTDHPTKQAIFPSLDAMQRAIGSAPTAKRNWYANGPGRIDTDFGGVHYQANVLGETASLFSCYPLDYYSKDAVQRILDSAQSFEEFCEELGKL